MLFEQTIRTVCSPDPLEEAKDKLQTRAYRAEVERRKARVHSALARSIPTAQTDNPAGHRVQA